METTYFASLKPPAVYRVDSFGLLDEVYQALPESPFWSRCRTMERSEVENGTVAVTELDASVILNAWSQRMALTPSPSAPAPASPDADRGTSERPDPAPAAISLEAPEAVELSPSPAPEKPRPVERSVWSPPSIDEIKEEETRVRLSRREALSAFRDLSGGSAESSGPSW